MLQVLNLFLALLLSSFGAESLQQSQDDNEANKLQEAVDRINRFTIFIKSRIRYLIKVSVAMATRDSQANGTLRATRDLCAVTPIALD